MEPNARTAGRERRWFAWPLIGGVLTPIACFCLDPCVLHDDWGRPLVRWMWASVFLVATFLLTSCAVAVALAARRPTLLATAAGTLYCGVGVALALGVALLPFSLIGLFIIVGVFGLTPFLAAHSYRGLARQALRSTAPGRHGRAVTAGIVLGLGLPALAASTIPPRARAALAQMLESPTPALRAELHTYHVLFGIQWLLLDLRDRLPWETLELVGVEIGVPFYPD